MNQRAQGSVELDRMQDIVGFRIVGLFTLGQQDDLTNQIVGISTSRPSCERRRPSAARRKRRETLGCAPAPRAEPRTPMDRRGLVRPARQFDPDELRIVWRPQLLARSITALTVLLTIILPPGS
jgi:hypothetical protein